MRRRSSLSLREIGVGLDQPIDENSTPCPRDCTHKSYVGFLDIRDMVSSIVYVTSNPIDEDEITYLSPNEAEADATPHHVAGLEGVGGLNVDDDEAPRLSILAVMQEEDEAEKSQPLPSPEALEDEQKTPEVAAPTVNDTQAATALAAVDAVDVNTGAGAAAAVSALTGGAHGELKAVSEEWDTAVKEGMRKFRSGGSITVSYLARRNPFRSIRLHSSLLEVADMFRKGAHRIAVSEGGRVVDIVSQRSFVSWLQAHAKKGNMGPIADMPLKKANLGCCNVITVKNHATVRKALELMDTHGKSGIAIVDEQGRLVGATSTRLVKSITRAREPAVFEKQVSDVMKEVDKTLNVSSANGEKVMVDAGAVVMFEGEASVGDALDAMVTHNTNRVFTVDEEGFPARVVTLGDIISAAFAH
jgi:CBS domain-containing protein